MAQKVKKSQEREGNVLKKKKEEGEGKSSDVSKASPPIQEKLSSSTAARAEQQLFLGHGLYNCINRPTASGQEHRHMYVSYGTLN